MMCLDGTCGQSSGTSKKTLRDKTELGRAADRTFLRALPAQTRARLLHSAKLDEFSKGQALFRAGDPAPTLNLLVEGHVEFTYPAGDGSEGVFAVLHPVTTMAPGAPLGNLEYRFNARAADRACLLLLPAVAA